MKTGIVVGTYNNALHVGATLASVRGQEDADWQCVVVDNGSTDDTVARVRALIEGDTRFQLFTKANEGPSAGRNAGFGLLPKEVRFVHFLDGDDVLAPGFIRRLTGYLEENPAAGLVACQFDFIDEGGRFLKHGFRSRYRAGLWGIPRRLRDEERVTPFAAFFAATGQGPFAVFRREIFARATGYEPDFWSHEDCDMFCQMALLAEAHQLPDRLYFKRRHAGNLTGSAKASYPKFRKK